MNFLKFNILQFLTHIHTYQRCQFYIWHSTHIIQIHTNGYRYSIISHFVLFVSYMPKIQILYLVHHRHTHTQIHTCAETPAHMDTDRYTCRQTHMSAHGDIHKHMHICLHTQTHIQTCTEMCMWEI